MAISYLKKKKKKSKEIAVKQLRLKSNNMKEIGKKVKI